VSTETSNQHHPTHDPGQNPDPQGQRRPRFSFSDALVKEQAGSHRQSSATTGPAPDQGQARRPRLCRRRLSARSAVAAGADGWSYRPTSPTPSTPLRNFRDRPPPLSWSSTEDGSGPASRDTTRAST
jgi:hypothetical protein